MALSLDPQLTLNTIFNPTLQHLEAGGHATANARVMKKLLAWMIA